MHMDGSEAMTDDEPAFPQPSASTRDDGTHHMRGMTLRDYFAARALGGLITWEDGALRPASDAALLAYDFADAMLAERNKT
jgi:hypothetical protein